MDREPAKQKAEQLGDIEGFYFLYSIQAVWSMKISDTIFAHHVIYCTPGCFRKTAKYTKNENSIWVKDGGHQCEYVFFLGTIWLTSVTFVTY